ncbi:MAG: dTMP kinase [Spirochaetales bacterium]|nr:dTMP kinase [Spirochaetales bacterium]
MGIWDKFVVLEGLDGSGTTTQLDKLVAHCQENGIPCYRTFEPSDGFIGRACRDVLEKRETAETLTLAQLFAADRREHLKQIRSKLEEGCWVFCDRYLFSSLAYQSLNIDFETVLDLNKDYPAPGSCFYVECSVETSAARRGGRDSVDLYEKEALQRKVAQNYEKAFAAFYPSDTEKSINPSGQLYRIDGESSVEDVFDSIRSILKL